MIDYYRGSGTKLIFLRVPRAPVSPPDAPPKLDERRAADRVPAGRDRPR